MEQVSTAQLGRACHAFMKLAYPGGPDTIPPTKRIYFNLPADSPVADFLPPAAIAESICQEICPPGEGVRGYAFRLGSAHFPHLKLKVQLVDCNNVATWVFMVDTHDAYSRDRVNPPPGHPDFAAWSQLQTANRELKEKIELALEQEGFLTFNALLRGDLAK